MSLVISGDTSFSEKLLEKARGVDLLFHEVISDSGLSGTTEFWQNYHSTNHTSASELGEIASRAKPKLLVLYHVLFWGSTEETVLEEVRAHYLGDVVLADDLDVY